MHRNFRSILRLASLVSLAAAATFSLPVFDAPLLAQASVTASKKLDLQAGGEFVLTRSDYYPQYFKGYGAYATLDFYKRFGGYFGGELDFRQSNGPAGTYERTYEVGGRYVRQYGRFHPYGKVLVGRGVWNAPPFPGTTETEGNVAYNMFAAGGGVDYNLNRFVNLRADFEYQKWFSNSAEQQFLLPNGLTPYVYSFGGAYHFH